MPRGRCPTASRLAVGRAPSRGALSPSGRAGTVPSSHPRPAGRPVAGRLATVRTMTRWIELDGVVNMRDLGGLPTRSGGHTLDGRLVRSDNLQDLTPHDVRRLVSEVGVTDIIDLR